MKRVDLSTPHVSRAPAVQPIPKYLLRNVSHAPAVQRRCIRFTTCSLRYAVASTRFTSFCRTKNLTSPLHFTAACLQYISSPHLVSFPLPPHRRTGLIPAHHFIQYTLYCFSTPFHFFFASKMHSTHLYYYHLFAIYLFHTVHLRNEMVWRCFTTCTHEVG